MEDESNKRQKAGDTDATEMMRASENIREGLPTTATPFNPYAEFSEQYDPKHYTAPQGIDPNCEKGRIIDGKKAAEEIRAKLKVKLDEKVKVNGRKPGLVVVLVGENPASKVYVRQKTKACEEVGINGTLKTLPADISLAFLLQVVDDLNNDESVDGVLVQLPLPAGELSQNARQVINRIHPSKDVDGFHPENLGNLTSRNPTLRPCTPWGVMQLIWSTGVNPYGLECVVVGASNHVGRPVMLELLNNGAVVTMCHRFCRDLESHIRRAECVVVAAGKPGLVKGEWIRPGAIVIDIGINRLDNGKLCGDVDFEEAKKKAGWITPVPGGVGPMTVAMLLSNTVISYECRVEGKSFQ